MAPGGPWKALKGFDLGQEISRKERESMEEHWRWRMEMARQIAAEIDPRTSGVVAVYVFGSANHATAGPGSDIDLLIHFRGTPDQEKQLRAWLECWSRRLADMNYQRTGIRADGLLD